MSPAARPATPPAAPGAPAVAAPGLVAGPATVPPAWLPLAFLAASGVALVALGVAVAVARGSLVAAPTAPASVATVHVAVLGVLGTAVVGALHQFGPVVGRRPLRSVALARITLVAWVVGVTALPIGFATGADALVSAAGSLTLAALVAAAVNLSQPLAARGGGAPLTGLRWAVGLFVATACFGVVYALDRQAGWFPLLPQRVLAHAHLGLVGALGLAYVAVAEKLWPMFLLSHPPGRSPGRAAVRLVPMGAVLLTAGLLADVGAVVALGGGAAVAGMGCHLASLAAYVRHRRRPLEPLHAFVLAAAVALVVAIALGVTAGLAPVEPAVRVRLVAGEVAALVVWLTLAVVGHAHKIVPFVAYTALRRRGVDRSPGGGPLVFADLLDDRLVRASVVAAVAGAAALVAGVVGHAPAVVGAGGVALAVTGAVTTADLALGPARVLARSRRTA